MTVMNLWGKPQECISLTETEAVFKVNDAQSDSLDDVSVYWEVGQGVGNENLANKIITPKLISVSPNSGSAGGTEIALKIKGVGPKTEGLQVIDSSDLSICETIVIKSYGVV
jgi:hypothetical protein